MTSTYQIRPATLDDLEIIVQHRCAMFADMGHTDPSWLASLAAASRPWFGHKLRNRLYFAWFAVAGDGAIASGAGLLLTEWPPSITDIATERAMILNVYTEPLHRKRGLARQLVETALTWCQQRGIATVTLHASPDGRPLYTSLGFRATNEMRLHMNLSHASATTLPSPSSS